MRSFKEIFLANAQLDENGRHIGGTDKSTNHDYSPFYEKLFPDSVRSGIRNVMEIGCADGSSLLSFHEAFPNAHIVGLDITPSSRVIGMVDRMEFWLGNQENRDECVRAATNNHKFPDRKFDLIVEDALHQTGSSLLSLFWLWPFVAPGGVYVVEEWADVAADRARVLELFPQAEVVDTAGPFGGVESIVLLRKSL